MFFVRSTEKSAFLLRMYRRLKTVFLLGGQKTLFCIQYIYYNMIFINFRPCFFIRKTKKSEKKFERTAFSADLNVLYKECIYTVFYA